MTAKQILENIKLGHYAPLYFLMGEEAFYIDKIVEQLELLVVPEEAQSFDKTILYGLETPITDILLQAKQYPMIAKKQLVVIKEAQHLLSKIDLLESYAENPAPQTVLVFACKGKRLDTRKSIAKRLSKTGVLFDSKKIYENQIPNFIEEYLYQEGFKAQPQTILMLSNHLGSDLSKIANEIDKLKILIPKGGILSAETVEKHIGISKQFNYFEWTQALAVKDSKKSYDLADHFSQNSKNFPLVLTLGTLHRFFVRMLQYHTLKEKEDTEVIKILSLNYYSLKECKIGIKNYPLKKVTRIFSYLRQADAQLKGLTGETPKEDAILKELLFKILN